jgi:hypothetical protein
MIQVELNGWALAGLAGLASKDKEGGARKLWCLREHVNNLIILAIY